MDKDRVKWKPLSELPGKAYADMVMEALKNRNIPCYLKSLFGSGAFGVISGAGIPGAGDKIMVPEDKLEEAQQVLNDMFDSV